VPTQGPFQIQSALREAVRVVVQNERPVGIEPQGFLIQAVRFQHAYAARRTPGASWGGPRRHPFGVDAARLLKGPDGIGVALNAAVGHAKEKLHAEIDVLWTGPEIISETIPVDSIGEVHCVLKRPPTSNSPRWTARLLTSALRSIPLPSGCHAAPSQRETFAHASLPAWSNTPPAISAPL
jgi:hypothetical protein